MRDHRLHQASSSFFNLKLSGFKVLSFVQPSSLQRFYRL
jgi:hypothetical protein